MNLTTVIHLIRHTILADVGNELTSSAETVFYQIVFEFDKKNNN